MVAYFGAVVLTASSVIAQSPLPEGKGRELVQRECSKCHGLEGITRARMTKERWGEVVDDMVSRGASGSEEEIDQIIDYLTAHFGKVNANKASAALLESTLGLSADVAAAIVRYREKNSPFRNADDLKKVPGLDSKRIDELKDRLEY